MNTKLYFIACFTEDEDVNADLFVEAVDRDEAVALWQQWVKDMDIGAVDGVHYDVWEVPALTGASRYFDWSEFSRGQPR